MLVNGFDVWQMEEEEKIKGQGTGHKSVDETNFKYFDERLIFAQYPPSSLKREAWNAIVDT